MRKTESSIPFYPPLAVASTFRDRSDDNSVAGSSSSTYHNSPTGSSLDRILNESNYGSTGKFGQLRKRYKREGIKIFVFTYFILYFCCSASPLTTSTSTQHHDHSFNQLISSRDTKSIPLLAGVNRRDQFEMEFRSYESNKVNAGAVEVDSLSQPYFQTSEFIEAVNLTFKIEESAKDWSY